MSKLFLRIHAGWKVRWIRLTVYAVALGALMLVAGALAWPSTPTEDVGLPPLALRSSGYEDALTLAESGETTAALQSLTAYLKENPEDKTAQRLLVRLRDESPGNASTDNDPTSPSDDPTSPSDDPVWLNKVADIEALLPLVVDGLSRGSVVLGETDAVVPYDAQDAGDYAAARRVLYSVHDLKTAQAASSFENQVSKIVYPKNAQRVTIDGANAYFGTNGDALATVAYARGRYVFEVVITTGIPPSEFKQQAVAIATAFPDSPE